MTVPLTVLIGRSLKAAIVVGRVVQIDRVFKLADLLGPDRGDEVLDRQGVDDVVRGDAVGVQRLLVEIGLNLPDFAAIRQRNRGAGDRGQLRADEAGRVVEQVVSESLSLDRASCRIGTLEALKLRMVGGVMPAGICFSTVCDIAATWASAALMFTVGWKKILMIP